MQQFCRRQNKDNAGSSAGGKQHIVLWDERNCTIMKNMTAAAKRASETGCNMRVFSNKKEAMRMFNDMKAQNSKRSSTSKVSLPSDDEEEAAVANDLTAQQLRHQIGQEIMSRNGIRFYVGFKVLSDEGLAVATFDMCRESLSADGKQIYLLHQRATQRIISSPYLGLT